VFFDNGHTANCDNNMMHFPSWESFANTVEQLEIDVDNHDDSFLNTYGNLNEDDLNDLEESMGHNPDLPLKAFEEHHSFCSLRHTEAAAEEAWLDASDQPGWSMNDWQENRFIVDAVEQALYNPYNEIMICKVIYKEMTGGWLIVDFTHSDTTAALGAANEGDTLQEVVAKYGGEKEKPGAISAFVPVNPNTCFYKSSKGEGIQLSGSYFMRASHQIRRRTFGNSFIAYPFSVHLL
jgi:hypothetical protein